MSDVFPLALNGQRDANFLAAPTADEEMNELFLNFELRRTDQAGMTVAVRVERVYQTVPLKTGHWLLGFGRPFGRRVGHGDRRG